MQSPRLILAVLASSAALSPTAPRVDRRTALALPLAVVPVAARAATDDVIVSGTVSAADAVVVVGPDAALYVTMRRGGAPQAAFSKFKAVPEPSLAAVRIPMKGKSFPIDFSITKSALFPDAPALPDEIKDVALTVSASIDQDGVAGLAIADRVDEVDHLAGDRVVLGEIPPGQQLTEVEAIAHGGIVGPCPSTRGTDASDIVWRRKNARRPAW